MKKSGWYAWFLIFLWIGLSAQETRRLYIDKVTVRLRKLNGKHWDAFKGAPDVKIILSVPQGNQWKTVFKSPVMKDRYFIYETINTGVDLLPYGQLRIEVVDNDLARHDMIGKQVILHTEAEFYTSGKKEIQFGAVYSFVYFLSRYKTLDVTSEQRQRMDKIKEFLGFLEKSDDPRFFLSAQMEKSKKAMEELKKEIPEHPYLEELEGRYLKLSAGHTPKNLEFILEKFEKAKQEYEAALQQKEQGLSRFFERFKELLLELQPYKDLDIGKEAYERWTEWVMEQEGAYVQTMMEQKTEEAKSKLSAMLDEAERYRKSPTPRVEKMQQYEEEARPYAELLEQEEEERSEFDSNRPLLDRYHAYRKSLEKEGHEPKEAPTGQSSDLQISLYDSEDPVAVGEKTVYIFSIGNPTPQEFKNVRVVFLVPSKATFLEAALTNAESSTPYQLEGNKVAFEPLSVLASGKTFLFKVTVVAKEKGDMTGTFEVHADGLSEPIIKLEPTTANMPDSH